MKNENTEHAFFQLTVMIVGNSIGECKHSIFHIPKNVEKKSIGASGNCSVISTMPQINLDVLHPSGDYMES